MICIETSGLRHRFSNGQVAVDGHLSARDNLKIWTDYFRCPVKRIDEVLEIVGIINHGKLLFQGTFSDLLSKEKQGTLLETGNNTLAIQLLREKKHPC